MLETMDSATLWLNVTNIVLGLATALAVVVVGVLFFVELAGRLRRKAAPEHHPHVIHLPDLGPTMADGGDPSRKRD